MGDYRRLGVLVVIMLGIVVTIEAATLGVLFLFGYFQGGVTRALDRSTLHATAFAGIVAFLIRGTAAMLSLRVVRKIVHRVEDSETRFRATFENAAVGIAHLGLDGTWLRLNQLFCDTVGYPSCDLLNCPFHEITHPDDRAEDLRRFQELIRGEADVYSLEKRCFHRDGHIVWINMTNALQRRDDGRPHYVIAILRDVSLRKQAQDALSESELRMRALLDASRDEILLLSTEGRILAINRAARDRLARRNPADPLGANLPDMLPADQAAQRLATVREAADFRTMRHHELHIGSRWFDFWFYPVEHPEGDVHEVAVYAREITQRKRSEADLRKLWQAIEQSPVSVVITDPTGTIEYVNPRFSEATGYTRAEALGKNPRILKSGHSAPDKYAELWRCITKGEVWRGEFRNRKKMESSSSSVHPSLR